MALWIWAWREQVSNTTQMPATIHAILGVVHSPSTHRRPHTVLKSFHKPFHKRKASTSSLHPRKGQAITNGVPTAEHADGAGGEATTAKSAEVSERPPTPRSFCRSLCWSIMTNPVLCGSLLGVILALCKVVTPSFVAQISDMLGKVRKGARVEVKFV